MYFWESLSMSCFLCRGILEKDNWFSGFSRFLLNFKIIYACIFGVLQLSLELFGSLFCIRSFVVLSKWYKRVCYCAWVEYYWIKIVNAATVCEIILRQSNLCPSFFVLHYTDICFFFSMFLFSLLFIMQLYCADEFWMSRLDLFDAEAKLDL